MRVPSYGNPFPRLRAALTLSALILCSVPVTVHADRAPSDFDGDGLSELMLIAVGKTLSWQPHNVASGLSSDEGSVGIPGDHVIMADWFGSGRPQLGVVRVERGVGNILWRVRDPNGVMTERRFGIDGDTVVAAADFDGTGAADAVVVRQQKKKLIWFIAYDLMRGGTTTGEFVFGTSTDSIFYINPDGAGLRLGALVSSRKGVKVRLLNPVTGNRKSLNKFTRLPGKKGKLVPLPLRRVDGKDMLAIVRTMETKSSVMVLDIGKKTRKNKKIRPKSFSVPSGGDAVVGNYLGNPGFEVGVQSAAGVMLLNPFDGELREVSAPAGVLVDEININQLGGAPSAGGGGSKPKPSPTGAPAPTTPPDNGPPSNAPASLRSVCASHSPIGAGEMLVKSEISSHIHGGDPRATGYTVVCARLCPSNRNRTAFYYSNGELAGEVGYYGTFHGNGQPRLYGAAGGAPQHFANDIARKAAGIGNGKLYLQMSGATSGEGTNCKEFAPSGRNGSL